MKKQMYLPMIGLRRTIEKRFINARVQHWHIYAQGESKGFSYLAIHSSYCNVRHCQID